MSTTDQVEVVRIDVAAGWMCFTAKQGTDPRPDRLPFGLSRAIEDTFKQNPNLTIRETLPIVSMGNTVAIHVWCDG